MIDKKSLRKIEKRTLDVLKYSKSDEERGLALHKNSIVFDSLGNDPLPHTLAKKTMVQQTLNQILAKEVPVQSLIGLIGGEGDTVSSYFFHDQDARQEYKEVWERAGVTAISQTIAESDLMSAIRSGAKGLYFMDNLKDLVTRATSAEDIRRAKEENKHAIMWNIQNTIAFGGGTNLDEEMANIDLLYLFGVRVVQLTYNLRNFIGDGCLEVANAGLSKFGRKVIEHLNELGMLVDTSHSGEKTTLEAVECSKVTPAATHTSCKSVYYHERGKSDEELQAIAEKDGYVGIYAEPNLLGGKGTLKEFLDHVDYAVDLIGIDRVGIGTDIGYGQTPPIPQPIIDAFTAQAGKDFWYRSGRGWWYGWNINNPAESIEATPEMIPDERERGSLAWINWPYYTVGLVTRGYSDQEIKKIIGGNFLKIIEKVVG